VTVCEERLHAMKVDDLRSSGNAFREDVDADHA